MRKRKLNDRSSTEVPQKESRRPQIGTVKATNFSDISMSSITTHVIVISVTKISSSNLLHRMKCLGVEKMQCTTTTIIIKWRCQHLAVEPLQPDMPPGRTQVRGYKHKAVFLTPGAGGTTRGAPQGAHPASCNLIRMLQTARVLVLAVFFVCSVSLKLAN